MLCQSCFQTAITALDADQNAAGTEPFSCGVFPSTCTMHAVHTRASALRTSTPASESCQFCNAKNFIEFTNIQTANMATTLLEAKQRITKAEAAAQPSVVHLRTLHTDPAAAKEFAMIRDDNARLQKENVKLRAEVEALQFKATDQVRPRASSCMHTCCASAGSISAAVFQQNGWSPRHSLSDARDCAYMRTIYGRAT